MSGTGIGIDVHVTGGGIISNGQVKEDPKAVAKCTICSKDVDAAATIGAGTACAVCLRERLDALSVARFRLGEAAGPRSIPWGKVTG